MDDESNRKLAHEVKRLRDLKKRKQAREIVQEALEEVEVGFDIPTTSWYKGIMGAESSGPETSKESKMTTTNTNTAAPAPAAAEPATVELAAVEVKAEEGFFLKLGKFPGRAWNCMTNDHAGKTGLIVGAAATAAAVYAASKTEKGKCMLGGICSTGSGVE